ncbi:MAG TPA: hypothetical protein VJX67_25160, partial [Blastocatellia bacterium]|nr:hypothetical protein [Blastocatellia bacterium]
MFQQMGAQKAEDLDAGKRLRGLESGSRLTASSESIEDTAARLEDASPEQVLEWAFTEFGDQLTIATGFGTEGSAIIDMAVKI